MSRKIVVAVFCLLFACELVFSYTIVKVEMENENIRRGFEEDLMNSRDVADEDAINQRLPQFSPKCLACRYGMNLALWKFRQRDGTYPGLPSFIARLCVRLRIETRSVCRGMVRAMQNETLYLLTTLGLSGRDVCGLIFPSQCPSPGLSWNSVRWTVPIPPTTIDDASPVKSDPKPSQGQLRVLQISDIHIDLQYRPGAAVDCDEPLCCRGTSDVTLPPHAGGAGYWGTRANCDIPYWTLENALATAAAREKYDYILWTGDLPAHNDWSQNRQSQLALLRNLTALLLKHFPDTPVYPALGNHESYPVNSFPPQYVTGAGNSIDWLYDVLAEVWSPWLPREAVATVRQFGYYTLLARPGFRVISLNTNYCNNMNFWMLIDPRDPDGELEWFAQRLAEAERDGEKVHVIGHIPPAAGGDCLPVWRDNFYAIVERFSHVIAAQFFGHTHLDELEIQYGDDAPQRPFAVAFVAPSLTTYSDLNPGYRVYDVNNATWSVADSHTYVMNVTEANLLATSSPEWRLLYSAKEEYDLADLSATSWGRLVQSWLAVRPSARALVTFQRYYYNFYKGNPPVACTTATCRRQFVCKIPVGNFTFSICAK